MILCDRDLMSLGPKLLTPFDSTLVNPASIDIRIGNEMLFENDSGNFIRLDISVHSKEHPRIMIPGEFALVETLETLSVPNGYAVDLKLKSSRAREGFNHSLAFWFDPGWYGKGTMELQNVTQARSLAIWPGMRIAQIIVHRLSGDAINPYTGKYQGALTVERSKE